MDRRKFLRTLGIAGAAAAIPWKFDARTYKFMMARAYPFAQSPTNIRKFVTTLPGVGPAGANNIGQYLPLATKTQQPFAGSLTDIYKLGVAKFGEKMHPDLKKATHFWGYYDLAKADQQYLAGVIVAKRRTPVLFNVTNQLPPHTLIPVDPTIMAGPAVLNGPNLMVGQLPLNRIVTHLHGGLTPWFSDGTPFQWSTPNGMHGPSFMNVPGTNPPPGTATYYYPMDLSARLLWYHDHAIGITRTNAYAGIASALIITDDFESAPGTGLIAQGFLPDLVGIPLVIQDKTFVPANILTQDPTWQWGMESDLWYPHVYEPNFSPPPPGTLNQKGRWDYGPTLQSPDTPATGVTPLIDPSVVPEFFADTALVNGAPYPVVNVTDKTWRFRLLNASQARFWHLNLYAESSTSGEANTGVAGPAMYQIGTEGGFLPKVAYLPNGIPLPLASDGTADFTQPFNLLLAPAERADVLIDFTGLAGHSFILFNDAPAPFPGGDPRNDYFTGDPDQTAFGGAPTTLPGHGPNTRTILKIVVSHAAAGIHIDGPAGSFVTALNIQLANNFKGGNAVAPQQPGLLYHGSDIATPGAVPYGGPVNRTLTLNEDFDTYGRLIQTIGTTTQNGLNNQGQATWGRAYLDPVTENPSAGATEVWEIYNRTGDTHPIHFHLVNVQVIQRAAFDATTPIFAPIPGTERAPDANEVGWKETVRMNPGEVTTVIMQFNLPTLPASMGNPLSPRTGGHEYVWHCHILEHEEHDMMRPLVVT